MHYRQFKINRLVFIALVAVIFSACGFRVTRDPNILVVHLESDPVTLNPILATDMPSVTVNRYICETLLERDNETLEFKPLLASDFQISFDHLKYIFTIRDNVRWHDGVPFTADDVIYSFERLKDPKVDAAPRRSALADVVGAKKIDERTVEFTYRRPYFRALELLGGMPIVPKHIFDSGGDFNSHPASRVPVGTGPFRFKSWETGSRITLEKNPDYWKNSPAITGIVFKIIPNANVAFELLKKQALDLVGLRAIQWARQTTAPSFAEKFDKYRYWLPAYSFIGWNARKPYFEDRRVRIAMTMLLDRQTFLEKFLFGQGEVVSGGFYRFGDAYNEAVKPYPYDPLKAKALLDEAGWIDHDGDGIRDKGGVPFSFTFLSTAGEKFSQAIGLMLSEELKRVGIEMKMQGLERAAFLKLVLNREFDAVGLAWAMPIDEDPYQLWHSSQSEKGSNFVGFKNAEADKLIEEGRVEFDRQKRNAIYKKLHALIHEEEPVTFLFASPYMLAVSKRLTNVKPYKIGFDVNEWGVAPWPELKEW